MYVGRTIQSWKDRAPVVVGRYWLTQGMRYMNWTERLHRLALEFLFGVVAWAILEPVVSGWWRLGWVLLIAHTASMVFNGHLFALFKHDLYWFGFYRRWDDFAEYVTAIQQRLQRRPCSGLDRAEVYGSLTCGSFNDTSDLDLRFMAKQGFWNGWLVAHRAFEERFRSLFTGFPIDIYMFHSEGELARKMDLGREKPIGIFFDGKTEPPLPFYKAVCPVPESAVTDRPRPRVLIVCSAGGHLREALLATEGLAMDFDVATFRLPHVSIPTGARALHFLIDPHTSLWKYAVNALQSLILLLRVRPQVVLTTGAGIAIACALLGKCMGARLIVIETAACVNLPSRTGAFLYRFADLFIVQWQELLRHYPKAVYGGALL
jgi:beta-1,4-N-acetylglucosaminyltransferase